MQQLMVLITGIDGRLLTPFSLWLCSIVARPTCQNNANIKFLSSFSRFDFISHGLRFLGSEQWREVQTICVGSLNLLGERVNFKKK